MKKSIISAAIAAIALTLSVASCEKESPSRGPIYYSFVTTHLNGADDLSKISFVTDDGRTLVPNGEVTKLFKAREGQRIVIHFTLGPDANPNSPENAMTLYRIDTNVVVGKSAIVKGDEEFRALGTEGVSIDAGPNTPQTTLKFINLYVGTNAKDIRTHEFTIAYDSEDGGSEDILNLKLAHDSKGDSSPIDQWTWVSLPTDSFSDLLKNKKLIILSVKTRLEGIREIRFELPDPSAGGEKSPAFPKASYYYE